MRISGERLRVEGLCFGFGVKGLEFRVEGFELRISG